MLDNSACQQMLKFLDVDLQTKVYASKAGQLLEPHFDLVINQFYEKVLAFQINPHITPASIKRLKSKQKQHWRKLFKTEFDEEFFDSVRRIGTKHREIALDPMWYIASYSLLKAEFTSVIVDTKIPVSEKRNLIRALEKYVAVDMGLSLSAFQTEFLD